MHDTTTRYNHTYTDTQRRLVDLLEKEKTELKEMLEEKWREANKFEQNFVSLQDEHRDVQYKMNQFDQIKSELEEKLKDLKQVCKHNII